jgi:O-antigen ligase
MASSTLASASGAGPALNSFANVQAGQNPLLRVAFWITIFYVVSLVGRGPEIMFDWFGTSFYHITVLNVILVLLGLSTGALGKVTFTRICLGWIAYYAWITLTLPFSGYRSGSLFSLTEVLKSLPVLFFVAAFFNDSIETLRKGIWTLIWSGVVVLILLLYTGVAADDERLATTFGTFANANEVAMTMALIIPFFAFVAGSSRYKAVLRLGALALILIAGFTTLKTASRGGLLSLLVLAAVFFVRSGLVNKAVLSVVGVVAFLLAFQFLPEKSISRLKTMVGSESTTEEGASAVASATQRKEVLMESLDATIKHPIFGVGLGVYAPMVAGEAEAKGKRGRWLVTHNGYTQVSAEVGLPGLALWLSAIVSVFTSLGWVRRFTRGIPELKEMFDMAFALQVSIWIFLFNCAFASIAYNCLLFTMSGFSLALFLLAKKIQNHQISEQGLNPVVAGIQLSSPERRFSPDAFQGKSFGSGSEVSFSAPGGSPLTRPAQERPVKESDAPWRRNPRRYPPPPGTPSR